MPFWKRTKLILFTSSILTASALSQTMQQPSQQQQQRLATPSLDAARKLQLPSREETLRRDQKVYEFWNTNEALLENAWKEWNAVEADTLPKLDASLIHPKLRQAVEAAWREPGVSTENLCKDLWEEVAPGVFSIQFFDLNELPRLQQWLEASSQAGIPTRPPYGIVLNSKGKMVDPRSIGHLAAPDFQNFYKMVVDTYVRPLGRAFFSRDIRGPVDDGESFSFTIQYQGEQGGDKAIRAHTDASTVTFNINLDLTQTWTGSSLIFFDQETNQKHEVFWQPGGAVMHLGKSMHAALPIETGTRSNWVIWTFGGMPREYGAGIQSEYGGGPKRNEVMTIQERWTKPETAERKSGYVNRWSPF